jgi:MFS family permease
VLTTAQGAGAVAGAMCLAGLAARFGRGRVLAASLAALPPALILYGSAQDLWQAAAALLAVGLVYIGVLSGLSTVVQLRAPAAYRGRVLSLYLVALGVAYPIGSLIQGPVVDRIGIGWTTTATALLLAAVLAAAAVLAPGARRALLGPAPADAEADAEPAGPEPAGPEPAGPEPGADGGPCAGEPARTVPGDAVPAGAVPADTGSAGGTGQVLPGAVPASPLRRPVAPLSHDECRDMRDAAR